MPRRILLTGCECADARGARPGPVDILVSDGRIEEVAPARTRASGGADAHADARCIDLAGATVVPGLVNMHSHLSFAHPGSLEERAIAGESRTAQVLRMAGAAMKALRAGVTTMRLVGEPDGLDIDVRDGVRGGRIEGPRIVTAGAPITYPGGHGGAVGALAAESAEGYTRLAEEQIRRGADLVKVMMCGGGASGDLVTVHMGGAEFAAVRAAARASDRRISVHTAAVPDPIMDMLIEDGVDTLEHCYRQSEEMLRRCIERDLLHLFTPLVTRSPDYFEAIELPLRLREGIAQAGEAHWSAVCRAVRAGARIALGTDFLSHLRIGGTWAVVHELELYEEAGMEPARLLEIASRAGAAWLGWDDVGLIEEGFRADMLVLDRQPMEAGAAAFRTLQTVISDGRVYEAWEPEMPVQAVPAAGTSRPDGVAAGAPA